MWTKRNASSLLCAPFITISNLLFSFSACRSIEELEALYKNIPPLSQTVKEFLPETVAPSRITSSIYGTRLNTPISRPHLISRTQGTVNARSAGPGATAASLNSAVLSGSGSGDSATGNSLTPLREVSNWSVLTAVLRTLLFGGEG
jgi:hypothetical protein